MQIDCEKHGTTEAINVRPHSIMCSKCANESYEAYAKKENIPYTIGEDGVVTMDITASPEMRMDILNKGLNERPVSRSEIPGSMAEAMKKAGLINGN